MLKLIENFKVYSLLVLTLMFFTTTVKADKAPVNGDSSTSSMCFDMDACSAFESTGTNVDYSEFVPKINNSSTCLQMSSSGLYREDPLRNPHSCTSGVNGSVGVCVSSVAECTYPAGHMRSIRIDVQVTPGSDGSGTLSSLNFYEQAPTMYNWIDGPSGPNNYPTLYGVRVLRDGTEVWRSADNATTNDWTLESFSFINEPAFTVTEPAVFTFELVGYCMVGNGALVNAWDIDELTIESTCGIIIDGGTAALPGGGTSTSVCVGTGAGAPVDFELVGNEGPNGAYIITDDNGQILALPTSLPFDFEGAGPGRCFFYFVSYSGTLNGLSPGNNIADLDGCFDLSNSVTIDRFTASGGTITSPNAGDICATGSNVVDVSLSGNVGDSRWLITDTNGNIIGLPSGPPFDLTGISVTECLIWHLSSQGNIGGLALGSNAADLSGSCISLSNSIPVSKVAVDAGVLQSNGVTFINICEGNGTSNVIDIQLANNTGANSSIVLTDETGNIVAVNPSFPFDFGGFNSGTFRFNNVSWISTLNGLSVGSNINNLSGFCFDVSNSVTIDKESASGGTITSPMGGSFDICIEGIVSEELDFSLSGAEGEFTRWIITDPAGNIIALPSSPPFVVDPGIGNSCVVRHLGFESSFSGLFLGQNISEFTGCFGLSNPVNITKISSSGGTISQGGVTNIDICGVNSSQVINIDIFNNFGANSQFIISDTNGNIISLTSNPSVDFTSLANGSYDITHVSYYDGISGLSVGSNISSITANCLDFSNSIRVNKTNPIAGTISSPLGGVINVCNDGVADMIDVTITGNSSTFNRWLVTDANGTIIGLPGDPPFNFEGFPAGTCMLWNLSFENGIGGIGIGLNVNDLSGCFRLSNSITINKQTLSAGSITTTGGGVSASVCLEDNEPDVVSVSHTGFTAPNGTFVITDDQGNILDVTAGPDFDFAGTPPGICRIYFVAHDNITGLAPGGTISGLGGCFALSNSITVFRSTTGGGSIATTGGMTDVTVCVSDGNPDLVDVVLSGSNTAGTDRWIITDDAGNILALPSAPPFDFEPTGVGVCNIYNVNFSGNISGLEVGLNIGNLEGCFSLSNSIVVNRFDFDTAASSSTLVYNMNGCSALTGSTQFDYDEFTPIANNSPTCTNLSGSNVYRNDPMNFPHSCTAGVNGSTAICVSSFDNCTYEADNDHSLRFDVNVTPSGNGTATLNTLSFYEAAPVNFQWINGTSGPNNYPTLYGIRVLKNGAEVFRQEGIATTNTYSLENFDFTSNPEFTVTTATTFSFELLGYCLIGNNTAPASAWDIDQITITSNCAGGLNGGDLSINGGNGGTSIEYCVDDGDDDLLFVNVLNAAGPNMAYVITDDLGNILALPMAQPFNFEGIPGGICLVWNLAYINGLQGAVVGGNANNLSGCFSLSNPVTVVRNTGSDCTVPLVVGPTTITAIMAENANGSFCVTDGISDMIDMEITGNTATGSAWIRTNAAGVILDMPTAFPYDLEGTTPGQSNFYHVAFEGELTNLEIGNNIQSLGGNYALSNSVIVRTESCFGPHILQTEYPSDFSIYPNPSSDVLTIQNDVPSQNGATFYIYDSFGQVVGTHFVSLQAVQVNIADYSEGLYYIKMIAGENESSRTFTKM